MRRLILGVLVPALWAQDDLLKWLDKIAQQELDQRAIAIAQVQTVAQAEQRKQWVRNQILQALGGLPDYTGPLNARLTGSILSDGYVIEKIIYESLPGFYVTANLYRPTKPGRYPAVLLQSGHTQEGKSEPQLLAINLALKGFVVLSFDPIGQGEREQTWDPQLKAPAAGWSVPEHIQGEAQARLINQGLARYFIWDARRSLDYLASRPDVDANRMGAAGCSGGGALTTFFGALDPRLKAVIPACFPESYRVMFTGSDPHAEMAIPRELAQGLDTADFVELSAPTPWLIQATEKDYFSPVGVKMVYEEARRWYKIYGAEEKIAFFVGPGGHGTPLVSREAVYQWMIRWLQNGEGDFHEQPAKLYPNHELLVTRTGHVEDEPGSRKLFQLIYADLQAHRQPLPIEVLLAGVRSLKLPTYGSAPPVKMLDQSGRLQYESEPGIQIDGTLYLPQAPGRRPAVLLLAGKLSDALAERMAKAGRVVLEIEPRHSTDPSVKRPFMSDWRSNGLADLVGRNLPEARAHDILRAVDLLASRSDVDPSSIRAAAHGVKGIWLLLAAACDPRIGKIWLDHTPHNVSDALENSMNTDLPDAVIPGFLLHWDLDDLRKAMGTRNVLWTDPTNWMGRVVAAGPRYEYRYVLGDLTDQSEAQDNAYTRQFLQ
jgi:cephalosporin-C deacetylase-like acetyl esterase